MSRWKLRNIFLRNKTFLEKVFKSESCNELLSSGTIPQLKIIFQVLHCILHGKIPMNKSTKTKLSKHSEAVKKIYESHFSLLQSKQNYLNLLQPLEEIIPGSFFYLFNKKS